MGVVLNGIPRTRTGGYGYGYYKGYLSTDEEKDSTKARVAGNQKRVGLVGKARKALSNVIHAINSEG